MRIKSLVIKLCCNYYDGDCLLLDDGEQHECPQCCSSSIVCRWFLNAVLPQDSDLHTRLVMPPKTKVCKRCGRFFVYKSRKAQHCPDCKKKVERIQAAERKRRQRAKSDR
ncbi:MAG: cysteine-rich VLP protein [Clostridia bacterium]|nr:cysteine-rich VLP protein [Clostridia bacterium]MBQ3461714.1 cysteine-rich VLP protein [Clostridia bacterium]